MPSTKRGIFHNLKESKYTVSNGETVLFFSSQKYMNKFMKDYESNREQFNNKWMKLIAGNPFNMETLADINFYKAIEKRGFRVWLKGVEISWQELHRYSLRKMTEEESPVWKRIETPKLKERVRLMRS